MAKGNSSQRKDVKKPKKVKEPKKQGILKKYL